MQVPLAGELPHAVIMCAMCVLRRIHVQYCRWLVPAESPATAGWLGDLARRYITMTSPGTVIKSLLNLKSQRLPVMAQLVSPCNTAESADQVDPSIHNAIGWQGIGALY
jgi:hypothetical protein